MLTEPLKDLAEQLKRRVIDRQYDVINLLIDSGVEFSEDELLTVITSDD